MSKGNLLKDTPYSEITATLETLDHLGVTRRHFAWLRSDKSYAERVAEFMLRGGFESTTSQKHSHEIMGSNFFGIEEAIKHFGVNPSRQQLAALAEIPFSKAVLEQSKDTHVLVAVFPLSIVEMYDKVGRRLFIGLKAGWRNWMSFATWHDEVSWQLVRKTEVANSTFKSRSKQEELLGKDDEIPTAQVMVYTIIGYCLVTNERLFEHIYVRTSSLVRASSNPDLGYEDVIVGKFALTVNSGLHINSTWSGSSSPDVGLASARRALP